MKLIKICKISAVLFILLQIMSVNERAAAVQLVQQAVLKQTDLRVVTSTNVVNRGGVGIITIQGQPGELYRIRSSFRVRSRTIPVSQWRTADRTGLATFNWVVGQETVPGTYPVVISGGGRVLELTHTVLP